MEFNMKPGLLSAILDQFEGRKIAFAAVTATDAFGACFGLGIAEVGIGGYTPIPTSFCRFNTYEGASSYAEELNQHLGHQGDEAPKLILSTMRRTLSDY